MKSAYLYVRVSTDEQKRKGYSLPEQEDRLSKYCAFNDIEIKGIYREDYSAKDFNRPEWIKLIRTIKRNSSNEISNLLFVKWDRFSRNVAHAYEMLGILRKNNTTALAIDQPIDFKIPESAVMLAVYLAIPEAENGRRSLNTSNGMRRAKQLGRYPNKAPLGYINLTAPDGKKYIALSPKEAELIKWSFEQLSKNVYRIEQVRRMVNAKGLIVSKSRFWALIHNPVYCGFVTLSPTEGGDRQLIKGIHQPIISEKLFYEVQNVISSKRKPAGKTYAINEMFILHRYLTCPTCNKILRGSYSQGKTKRYPYYHCSTGCKTRFNAGIINDTYQSKLSQLSFLPSLSKLFNLVLEDVSLNTRRTEILTERKILLQQIDQQEQLLSKARKLFISDRLEFDDFSKLKNECGAVLNGLKDELERVLMKLRVTETNLDIRYFDKALSNFSHLDLIDRKHIVELISPAGIGKNGDFSLQLNSALSQILSVQTNVKYQC